MTDQLTDLIAAIEQRAWYPIFGLAVAVLLAAWRAIQPAVWNRIPTRWKPVPALVGAVAAAFATAYQSGETWQVAVGIAVYTLAVTWPTALGSADAVLRLTGTKSSSELDKLAATLATPSSPTKLTTLLLVLVPLIATGCAGTFEEARLTGLEARDAGANLGSSEADYDLCWRLATREQRSKALAAGGAVLTGAAGLPLLLEEVGGEPVARATLVGLTVAAATATAILLADSDGAGKLWVERCAGDDR